ncbi:MAG: hypothetical protein H0W20_06590 [Chthoniobacterales bacterium]|nr:hypothetical protein [Chthoniobacterales bacterium]
MRRLFATAVLAVFTFVLHAPAAVFTVTSTANTGVGSLRQAITDANDAAGADVINFNIQGTGVQVIALSSALPVITGPVTIDGYLQQPGASANTLSSGNNAVIRVELRGGGTGSTSGASGLAITAGNSVVRGLAINGFPGRGIDLSGSGNNRIEGCFIGTDAAGTAPLGNRVGVAVNGPGNIIGGTTPAARNVISASSNPFGDFNSHGISITGGSGNLVQGNFIGTDKNGTAILPNNGAGVALSSTATTTTIGGTSSAARNIISGNNQGISVSSSGATVQGNIIGLDVNGTVRLPNSASGVSLISGVNTIGGAVAGAGNVISGNNGSGIVMDGGPA